MSDEFGQGASHPSGVVCYGAGCKLRKTHSRSQDDVWEFSTHCGELARVPVLPAPSCSSTRAGRWARRKAALPAPLFSPENSEWEEISGGSLAPMRLKEADGTEERSQSVGSCALLVPSRAAGDPHRGESRLQGREQPRAPEAGEMQVQLARGADLGCSVAWQGNWLTKIPCVFPDT